MRIKKMRKIKTQKIELKFTNDDLFKALLLDTDEEYENWLKSIKETRYNKELGAFEIIHKDKDDVHEQSTDTAKDE